MSALLSGNFGNLQNKAKLHKKRTVPPLAEGVLLGGFFGRSLFFAPKAQKIVSVHKSPRIARLSSRARNSAFPTQIGISEVTSILVV